MRSRSKQLHGMTLLVCACILAQHLVLPLHVVLEDHCRVTDGPGARAGLGPRSSEHAGCLPHGHAHPHHDHADAHGGPEPAAAAEVEAAPGNRDCDGIGSHCPHPVEEHLVEMRGDPARAPSVTPVKVFLLAEIRSLPSVELRRAPRDEDHAESCPSARPEESPKHPRAPPTV